MTLSSGARLGPYEILTAIGAGGMGEVYKARDTRLGRTVAIKVLPADVTADPGRRQRFEREARAVAALNDPHIAALYDVGSHDGVDYLVMEYLEGQTLADRLLGGPLPLEEALQISAQIADALDKAHRHGIVHGDLKPGNVMLTRTGTARRGSAEAKLLDFGLARTTVEGDRGNQASRTDTLAHILARAGTLPYMAPEQLDGKRTDGRTDVFAFGAMLYEMVTGIRAFQGASPAGMTAAILEHDPPPMSALRPRTPPALERVVKRCLAKDPDQRWQSAADLADELRWLREAGGVDAPTGVRPGRARRRTAAWIAVFATAGVLVGAAAVWLLRSAWAPSALVVRSSLEVRPAEELDNGVDRASPFGSQTAVSWTPDGRALVFVGRRGGTRQIYVRALDGDEARPLAGTEGAEGLAVSPDGRSVVFWAAGALRKIPLDGGPVTEVASRIGPPPSGLSFDGRGSVYFGRDDHRIWRVSAEGELSPVTTPGETEVAHVLPWPLPGGEVLLYTVRRRLWSWGDEEVIAQTLASGTRRVLLRDAADARYVPTGHLVFLRRGVLFAVAFDPGRLEVRGTPTAVLAGVAQALTAGDSRDVTGAGQFAIAPTGTLAWVGGAIVPYRDGVLVSVDRRGQVSPVAAPEKSYEPSLRLSPDGRQLVVPVRSIAEVTTWTHDLVRGTLAPLAQGGEAFWPIWTPDGQRLVFNWLTGGRPSLAWQRADGTMPPEVLVPGMLWPSSWTPDGRHLAVTTGDTGDLTIVTFENGRATVQPLTETPYTEQWPEFSPDGHWLAYGSDVSGTFEVYVQAYPGSGPPTQVSIDAGVSPAWRADGRELFFLGPAHAPEKRRMMVASFEPGAPPRVGRPRPLFEYVGEDLAFSCAPIRCYDVARGGERFFVVERRPLSPLPAVTHINLVEDWVEELMAKVPVWRLLH